MIYGTITHTEEGWKIEGEPFVRARLKRVFRRVPQEAANSITISASPENSRELLWFLQRYPMSVDRMELLEELAQKHVEAEASLSKLLSGKTAPRDIPLSVPAREYQKFAAEMLELKHGYLLADDLGIGKTVSAICGMVKPGNLPALVVCPAHLPPQWMSMIHYFAQDLKVHLVKKSTPYELKYTPDVLVISYHKLRGWAESLRGHIKYVVFDECQALRHPGTGIHRAAVLVAESARRRIGLSATPIYNYGNEFYHVANVLAPDALGTYAEFLREWCTPEYGGKARLNDPKEFGAYLRREGIMLRRTRAEVRRELPPLSKIVHEIDADEDVLEKIKGDAVALARVILHHNETRRGEKMRAAGEFDALMRQATGIAKAPYAAEFVKLLRESGEKIVLFGWHRAVYDIWMEALKDHRPVLYTGSESAKQKNASIESFVSGDAGILIVSLRSGAGVDGLQGSANTVVFGELDWSPGCHEQCIGRVHRDGQDIPCSAYFLLSNTGADPIMAEVLGIKRDQIEGVRNPEGALVEQVDTGENSIRKLAMQLLSRKENPCPSPSA